MVLMNPASLMPRRIMKWTAQRITDEQSTAVMVFPSPKTGKNRPSVDLIRMKYVTLPMQVPAQKPKAAANPR
jgi:hypothetical protein